MVLVYKSEDAVVAHMLSMFLGGATRQAVIPLLLCLVFVLGVRGATCGGSLPSGTADYAYILANPTCDTLQGKTLAQAVKSHVL